MVGIFTVFEQSTTLAVFAVFPFRRAEEVTDGIGSLVNALHLGATFVIGTEEIVPRIVVEKKKTVSR
ncbi:hypothetical protein HQ40_01245 [Porphyromonas gulae]|nr:hypothetical protein [Porphyromonas gulae]KGN77508.1 hypothetical protein HQ40_01245 [Porphyromonas gulae]